MSIPAPRAYSRAEYLSDAAVHAAGLAAVLGGVPVLIVLVALNRGDAASVAGVSVYGATLVAMISCSALYNTIGRGDWAWLLRRLDHSAIYLKIAGTYTAFVAVSDQGFGLMIGLWAAALAGVGLKAISPARFRWVSLALYLGMGWAGVLLGGALFGALSWPVIVLMATGGGLYTLGVAFYLWERLPFHNTIWHLFVLAATIAFYAAVVVLVMDGAV